MNSSGVPGKCEGLSATDAERVSFFMEKVIQAFEAGDPVALQMLYHPGGDPRGKKNSLEFDRSLMDGGDRVASWLAGPYSEPQWDIMRIVRHHPTPTVWIDVTLNDGQRDYPICFACSSDKEGVLRACYYVDR